jgi:hypothetical protein
MLCVASFLFHIFDAACFSIVESFEQFADLNDFVAPK